MTEPASIHSIAFIGTRGHTNTLLRELAARSDLKMVGVAHGGSGDSCAYLADWAHQHGHAPEQFDADWQSMLEQTSPHIVVVAGPLELHADMTIAAVERRIHVIVEKPAALTRDQLDRLERACMAHPQVQVAGMMFTRYTLGFYTARQMIAAGAIGTVRLIESRKTYKMGKRPAWSHERGTYGGSIPWIGSHAIDWTDFLTGLPCRRVFASHSARHNGGFGTLESTALIHLTLADEVFASVAIDVLRPQSASSHGDDWARVVGTTGVMEVRPTSVKLLREGETALVDQPVACDRSPLDDFVRGVRGERASLISTTDTLRLTDACLRALASADEARMIEFDE